MNLTILTGNVGHDVDVKTSDNGTSYANFSVCDNRRWNGEDHPNWTRVVAFNGKTAGLHVLGKGSRIEVRGHLEETETERDGVTFRHSQLVADKIDFVNVKERADASDEDAS